MAVLVPVLDRPHRIEPLLANIFEVTPSVRVRFAASDQPTLSVLGRIGAERLSGPGERSDAPVAYLVDDGRAWGPRINDLYRSTTEPYVFLGADDVVFHPGWLDAALADMMEVDGVVAVNDLYNPAGTLGLISRRYVEEEGGSADAKGEVICPLYSHWYSETEAWEVAKARDRFRYCAGAIVEHLHPATGKENALPVDGTYIKGNDSATEDYLTFVSRGHLWSRR